VGRESLIIDASFFDRDALVVARSLVGKVLRRKYRGQWLAASIVEAEAYYLREKGSHASLGRTPSREALFMPAGTIYMYYSRGGDSLNVSCRGEGNAVLVKSGLVYFDECSPETTLRTMQKLNPCGERVREPGKLCSGQTLLCRSLALRVPDWNQKTFDPERFYVEDVGRRPKLIQARRLGIPLGRDEDLPYRFVDYERAAHATQNPLTRRAGEYHIIEADPKTQDPRLKTHDY
jgi:DNA-3-methyladenine glycosylase